MIDWIEPASTVDTSKILTDRRNKQVTARDAAEFDRRVTKLLRDPKGFPNGKGKRTRLKPPEELQLRSGLVDAVEYAALFAARSPSR